MSTPGEVAVTHPETPDRVLHIRATALAIYGASGWVETDFEPTPAPKPKPRRRRGSEE